MWLGVAPLWWACLEEEEWGKVPQEVNKYGANASHERRGWKMQLGRRDEQRKLHKHSTPCDDICHMRSKGIVATPSLALLVRPPGAYNATYHMFLHAAYFLESYIEKSNVTPIVGVLKYTTNVDFK